MSTAWRKKSELLHLICRVVTSCLFKKEGVYRVVGMFGARPQEARQVQYATDEEFLCTVPAEVLVQGGHFFPAGAASLLSDLC